MINEGPAETFPVIFAVVFVAVALLFSFWVVTVVCRNGDGGESWDGSLDGKNLNTEDDTDENILRDTSRRSSQDMEQKDASSSLMRKASEFINAETSPSVLSWKNLSVAYPSKKAGGEPIYALKNVSGTIRRSELVGILGPSGGGKTSLLDMLSGRKTIGKLSGEMSIMGKYTTDIRGEAESTLRNVSAYVPQQEEFFPTQTPREAISFFAHMRLGHSLSPGEVDRTLGLVGLPADTWDRPIGGTQASGVVIRGLSGGERKRLALACALSMKPSILFLDEVTSGLDSENAILVTKVLKKACSELNTTVVLILHQPGLEVFEMFDRLILLSRGHCFYNNPFSKLPEFYEKYLKKDVPERHLIAGDLLYEATNRKFTESSSSTTDIDFIEEFEVTKTIPILNESQTDSPRNNTFAKFRIILIRNLTNHYLRNLTNLASRTMIYLFTSAITGAIFWDAGSVLTTSGSVSSDELLSVIGAAVFMEQNAFLLPFAQVSTFFYDKKVFASEKALGLYPSWMYALCQFILESWVYALTTPLQAGIYISMISLWNPELSRSISFAQMLSFYIASGLMGNGIVLFFSMICFSSDVAFLVSSSYVVCSFAASGAYVTFDNMQPWIRWLQWVSPMKYALQMFTMCIFNGTDLEEAVLDERGFNTPGTISANLGVLLAMYAVFSCLTMLALSLQKEVR